MSDVIEGVIGTIDTRPIPVGMAATWSVPRPVPSELFAVYVDPPAVGVWATESEASEALSEVPPGDHVTRVRYRMATDDEPAPPAPAGVYFPELYVMFSFCPVPLPDGAWHLWWRVTRDAAEEDRHRLRDGGFGLHVHRFVLVP